MVETLGIDVSSFATKTFLSCLKTEPPITKRRLEQRIDETKQLLRKSFFPQQSSPSSPEEFNFDCYVHFRVYNEILVKEEVTFPPFKREFESMIGNQLLQMVMLRQPSILPSAQSSLGIATSLQNALQATDNISNLLQRSGLITSWERSVPPDDDIEDFVQSTTSAAKSPAEGFYVSPELAYSVALDGDVTLSSQLLLQELGYRLYPSFGRWLIERVTSGSFTWGGNVDDGCDKVSIECDEYYMDTGYNSDPSLFEVRQVLLNIVIQSN